MYLIIYKHKVKWSPSIKPEHFREAKSGLIKIVNTTEKTMYHNQRWDKIPEDIDAQ